MTGKSSEYGGKTCCFCIEISTAVKLIAVWIALAALSYGANIFYQEDKINLWIPLVAMYTLSFFFFIFAFIKKSVLTRHILWASYVLIAVIGSRCLVFHYIYQGKMFDNQILCVPS